MKEILMTSDIALMNERKEKLANNEKQLRVLLKGLKPCEPIKDDLLISLIVRINANTLLK
jgi:hypothetical protein